MYLVENKSKSGKKIYRSILLRQSYREEGKVKKRTIANLSNCAPQEIEAIKLALGHKDDLSALGALSGVELQEGLSVGAAWSVYQVAKELGIEGALGKDFSGEAGAVAGNGEGDRSGVKTVGSKAGADPCSG